MATIVQMLGIAAQALGVAILHFRWRARRGSGGAALAAGWMLICLGSVPWLLTASPERAFALAALPPMVAGLVLLAPAAHARSRYKSGLRKSKPRNAQDGEAVELAPTLSGRLSRNAARWTGAVIGAPMLALAAMAAWQAFFPGQVVDRIAFSIFVLMGAGTGALLWTLSTARPWRATLITCATAITLGGSVYWFTVIGAR